MRFSITRTGTTKQTLQAFVENVVKKMEVTGSWIGGNFLVCRRGKKTFDIGEGKKKKKRMWIL
jgi:hypothetical protein